MTSIASSKMEPGRAAKAHPDLRDWLESARDMGELAVLEDADSALEIGAVAEVNARQRGPAVLFDSIRGYPKGFRVLVSSLVTPSRLALTLGLESRDERQLLSQLEGSHTKWMASLDRYPPHPVSDGPVLENVLEGSDIDLTKFPAPLWNERDGGRYIGTGDAVVTQDPETGSINVGTYRIMVHGARTLGIYVSPSHHGSRHIRKYHAAGKPCPVVISFGHHPLMLLVGGLAIPYEACEYNYAGAVAGRSIDVVRGKLTGLPIPAASEIAIEGFIPPGKVMPEGPFGEYTGYYTSGKRDQGIVEVAALYHRNDPIILGAMNNKPPHDYTLMHAVLKSMIVKEVLAAAGVPEVKAVWFHEAAAVNFLMVVSIHQMYEGHPTQAGLVAAQCQVAATGNGRYVVVVDDDIDPMNLDDVIWAVCTRSNPETSIDIIRRTYANKLDPMAPRDSREWNASRAVIDACRPFSRIKEFPEVVEASPEVRRRVVEKWSDVLSPRGASRQGKPA